MFNKRMLIAISGISKSTFYRRLGKLTNQHLVPDNDEYLMEIEDARKIARAMGFEVLFEKHIEKITK